MRNLIKLVLALAEAGALPSCRQAAMAVAASGCAVVASNRGYEKSRLGEFATYCDSADLQSIRRAVLAAFERRTTNDVKRAQLKQALAAKHDGAVIAQQHLDCYRTALTEQAEKRASNQLADRPLPMARTGT